MMDPTSVAVTAVTAAANVTGSSYNSRMIHSNQENENLNHFNNPKQSQKQTTQSSNHVRKALDDLYLNQDGSYNYNDDDNDNDDDNVEKNQLLISALLVSPTPQKQKQIKTNQITTGSSISMHKTTAIMADRYQQHAITFTDDEDNINLEESSEDSTGSSDSTSVFSLSELGIDSWNEKTPRNNDTNSGHDFSHDDHHHHDNINLQQDKEQHGKEVEEFKINALSQHGTENYGIKSIPQKQRLTHPNISFENMNNAHNAGTTNIATTMETKIYNDTQTQQHVLINNNEKKYQVELENMRQVTEQVQNEADEKIQQLQNEYLDLQQMLHEAQNHVQTLQQEQHQHGQQERVVHHHLHRDEQQNDKEEQYWKNCFNALVEQLCQLEESGQWKSHDICIDEIVLECMKEEKHCNGMRMTNMSNNINSNSNEIMIGDRLRRLSQSSRKKQRKDIHQHQKQQSTMDEMVQTTTPEFETASSGPASYMSPILHQYQNSHHDDIDALNCSISQPKLDSSASYATTTISKDQMNHLLMENTKLRTSLDEMKYEITDYKEQIQSLQGFKEQLLSPITTTAVSNEFHETNHHPDNEIMMKMTTISSPAFDDTLDQMNKTNAKLQQENVILSQGQSFMEQENIRLAQRSVELETIAEEATKECERLHIEFQQMKTDLQSCQTEKDDIIVKLQSKVHDLQNQLCQNQSIFKELHDLKRQHNIVNQSKLDLEHQLDLLVKEKEQLQMIVNEATVEIRNSKAIIEEKENQLEQMQSNARVEADQVTSDLQRLTQEHDVLKEQSNQIAQDATQYQQKFEEVIKENDTILCEKNILQEKLKYAENEMETFSIKNVENEDECRRLRNLNTMIKSKVESNKSNIEGIVNERDELKRRLTLLQSSLEVIRTENVTLSDSKSDLQMKVGRLEEEIKNFNMRSSHLDREKEEMLILLDKKEHGIKEQQAALETNQEQLRTISSEKNQHYRELKKLKKAVLAFRSQVDEKLKAKDNERTQLTESLETIRKEMHGVVSKLKQEINSLLCEKEKEGQKVKDLEACLLENRNKLDSAMKDIEKNIAKNNELEVSLTSCHKEVELLLHEKEDLVLWKEEQLRLNKDYENEVNVLKDEKKKIDACLEDLEKNQMHYEEQIEILRKENQIESCMKLISQSHCLSQERDETKKSTDDCHVTEFQDSLALSSRSLNRANIEKVHTPMTELNGTAVSIKARAPSTGASGLSTVQSSLFSMHTRNFDTPTVSTPFPINMSTNTHSSLDAMLDRIKSASSKSSMALQRHVSHTMQKRVDKTEITHTQNNVGKVVTLAQEKDAYVRDGRVVTIEETEALVKDILDRCGKR